MTMLTLGLPDHPARGHVQRGEQTRRAVPDVVMRQLLRRARTGLIRESLQTPRHEPRPPRPATPQAAQRHEYSASHPRTPTRSSPASPTPATTSAAASTASTQHARHQTTPTSPALY